PPDLHSQNPALWLSFAFLQESGFHLLQTGSEFFPFAFAPMLYRNPSDQFALPGVKLAIVPLVFRYPSQKFAYPMNGRKDTPGEQVFLSDSNGIEVFRKTCGRSC